VLVARCAVLVGGGVLEVPSVGNVVPKNPAKGTRTTKIQTTVYEPARLKWELMTALRRESKGDGQGQPEDRDELLEERRRQDAGVRGKRQKEAKGNK